MQAAVSPAAPAAVLSRLDELVLPFGRAAYSADFRALRRVDEVLGLDNPASLVSTLLAS